MLINQVQTAATINLNVWIPLFLAITTIILNILNIKKVRSESNERQASKTYVREKVAEVETKVLEVERSAEKKAESLESMIREQKKDNIREHDDIKREFQNSINSIDDKLDIVISFVNKTSKD